MAKRFTVEMIMNLAKAIGANPNKFMGTKTNINFLGKGPTKNPLFQNPLAGIETATEAQLGKRESIIEAVEDAMGYLSSGKLNSIQSEILGHNLSGIHKIYNPPPLPMASVTPIRSGIKTVAPKPRSDIDRLLQEGHTDARGRRWDFGAQGTGPEAFNAALNQKTGMSRAISRELLLQDTRIKLKPEELFMLKEGKGEPLDLMRKYYGKSMRNLDAWLDDFLPTTNLPPRDLASRVLSEVELIPQFAEGGRIGFGSGGNGGVHSLMPELDALTWKSLEGPLSAAEKDRMELLIELTGVLDKFKGSFAEGGRAGYSKGRIVKGALAILNRNKKNAEYMFKASDNVSPGYAAGDLKYNAELLADQLAEDAGVLYADLGQLDQIKFYGTAYDYLAKEMGQILRALRIAKKNDEQTLEQKMVLSNFSIKGRKPSASGGLAGILEV